MQDSASNPSLTNFGANIRFQPGLIATPRSEADVLEILKANRGKRFRAIGRMHSWSEAVVGEEVVIDTSHLQRVTVHEAGDASWVEVEAGCQIKHLLAELIRQGNFTLPAIGLITEQTIAGAAATGTHGSGRHSLSHYVQAVRIACLDPTTGEPTIRVIDRGDELRAARCALGCLGIITSVRLPIRKQYQIEEVFYRYNSLDEVLQQEDEYPLLQFYLVPWRWDYFAQQRRETHRSRSWLAWLYRLYWGVGMDVAFHRVLHIRCTKWFYRWIMPNLIPQGWRIVDRSDRQLTMEHELFRHIEIEVFVTRSQLKRAVEYAIWLVRYFGGERAPIREDFRDRLHSAGQWAELEQLGGTYLHHYPICFRKILPDDTLISMASGTDEPYYALSFISYADPARRGSFFRFSEILAGTMATLFDARPHWGKVCPLPPEELRRLYPHLDQFAAICEQSGSARIFSNNWLKDVFSACHSVPVIHEEA